MAHDENSVVVMYSTVAGLDMDWQRIKLASQSIVMTGNNGETMGMGGDAIFRCSIDSNQPASGGTPECTNIQYSSSDPTDFFDSKMLVPWKFEVPSYAFLRFERSSCLTTSSASLGITENPALNITFTLQYDALEGECMDYTDCYTDSDGHPSLRTSVSSTGNTQRMLRCAAMPKRSDPMISESRCMECFADCDCPGGSYCHADNGICLNNGVAYVCDADSHRNAGICRPKDIANEIINKPCRAESANTYDALSSGQTRTLGSAAVLVSEGNRDDRSDGITGAGFCGQARYYNTSNVDGTDDNIVRAGVARTILWTGECVNDICQECNDGSTPCSGDKTCIRGLLRDTIVVDGTIRTFTSNTVAGTALAGVMMIIVVQIIFVVYFVVERGDAHRQENEAKEAEKQKAADQKAAKAKKSLAAEEAKEEEASAAKDAAGAGASESKSSE